MSRRAGWPLWLTGALVAGALARAFLVLATPGSEDVPIWQSHAGWTWEHGLLGYYARSEVFNHPPFVGRAMAGLFVLARETGVPFAVLLRAPVAALDWTSAWLLLLAFRGSPHRYTFAAAHALNPLAIVLSAHHGNTDSAVATLMLLALVAHDRRGALASGAVLGLGLWIKLPVLLAAPALLFSTVQLRDALRFLGALGGVAALGSLPELWLAPELLARRVLGYAGRQITTPDGTPIWGLWSLLGWQDALPAGLQRWLEPLSEAHLRLNTWVCWLPILLLAWLRRRARGVEELGTTLCASLFALYAFTHNVFAFQYLAWVAPFLYFPGPAFAAIATALLGGYVYAVYAYLSGPLLLGPWDFSRTASWPAWLLWLRDAAVAFCLVSACGFLGRALRDALRHPARAGR